MKSATRPGIAFCVLLLGLAIPCAPLAAQIYLQAGFDDKPLDQPIGTGGPTVGEPIGVGTQILTAVRGAPMPTPCLEIIDNDDYAAGYVRFEFLDEAEISAGQLVISVDLWFPEIDSTANYSLAVREKGSSAHSFLSLDFARGIVYAGGAGGDTGPLVSFTAGRIVHVLVVFDMDADTYSIWIDGAPAVEAHPHGVVDIGIGAVLLSCIHDPSVGDSFFADNLYVGDYVPTPVAEESWGRVKSRFAGHAEER